MNKHMLLVTVTALATTAFMLSTPRVGYPVELEFADHKIQAAIQTLDDPSTFGASIQVNPSLADKPLAVTLNAVVSLERNLGEKCNGDISYNNAWTIPAEEDRVYRGLVGVEVGFESAPQKLEDESAGDWRFHNGNMGIVLKQHMPYTRIRMPWCGVESFPIGIGGSAKYIVDATGLENTLRGALFAEWDVPLFRTSQVSAWIGARGDWYWNDGTYYGNFEGRGQLSLPIIKKLANSLSIPDFGDPLLFVKYIKGAQPPEYTERNEWQFGLGTEFIW